MDSGLRRNLLLPLVFILSYQSVWAAVYVKHDASGTNDGSSWANAYTDLQDALSTTFADDIWVAAGTYYPGASGDKGATFKLKNKVRLYGGFAGTESSRNQRDWKTNVTILSGDIDQDDTWSGNSLHVVTASYTNASAVLDGFTVRMGSAPGPVHIFYRTVGPAMLSLYGSPTIRNVIFRDNKSRECGVYLWYANPRIENTKFIRNRAAIRGAGLCSNSALTLTDVLFSANRVAKDSNFGDGAGLYYSGRGTLSITRGRFVNNSALQTDTEVQTSTFGGGAYIASGDFVIRDSLFQGNRANVGGALHVSANGQIINTQFVDNTAYRSPALLGGTEGGSAAAISADNATPRTFQLINSLVANNTAELYGGGIVVERNVHADIRNSILWNNAALDPPGGFGIFEAQAVVGARTATITIDHSIVEGLTPDPGLAPGSSGDDPQFVDLAGNDFHLLPTSPAIDAGNNDFVPESTLTDLDRMHRRADDPAVADSGTGTAPVVDIGPYEFSATKPAAARDLLITTADTPDPALTGRPVTYDIHVTNIGTKRAKGVKFTDTPPVGTRLLEVNASTGSCKGKNPISCSLGDLAPAAMASVQLTVVPRDSGTLQHVATVTTTSTESATGNNTDSENTTVESPTLSCNTGTNALTVYTSGPSGKLAGVKIAVRGPNNCARSGRTDVNGELKLSNLPDGDYSLLPVLAGCSFSPPFDTRTVVVPNVTAYLFGNNIGCE